MEFFLNPANSGAILLAIGFVLFALFMVINDLNHPR